MTMKKNAVTQLSSNFLREEDSDEGSSSTTYYY